MTTRSSWWLLAFPLLCQQHWAVVHSTSSSSFQMKENASLLTYLHPRLLQDEELLDEVSESLRAGELVVIENAFNDDLAEHVHAHLSSDEVDWKLLTGAFEDGFHFHHHNIQEDQFTPLLQEVYNMFAHEDSRFLMEDWSGRDCSSDTFSGSASYYKPGDHSLPHSDVMNSRSVAFVWHLSKDWDPSWGGALYWTPSYNHSPFIHASFNSLVLFSVTPLSEHFVTAVSLEAQGKRLAFNGWYESPWIPSLEEDLEYLLELETQDMKDLTFHQMEAITDMDLEPLMEENMEDYEHLVELQEEIDELLHPGYDGVYYVDPEASEEEETDPPMENGSEAEEL